MPYLTVWIHYVWSTKNWKPWLIKAVRTPLYAHMRQNALAKGIRLDSMNGTADHLHSLVSLRADQSIAKIAQLIKGESSFWLNEQKLIPGHFQWQEEYYAASVSERLLDQIRRYIARQEQHHRVKTSTEEWRELMKQWAQQEGAGPQGPRSTT